MINNLKLRKSLIELLKAFFAKKLVKIYSLMFLYIALIIAILAKLGVWKINLLSVVIFWILFTSFSMLLNIEKVEEPKFIKNSIQKFINPSIFLGFLANLATFNLLIELALVPFLILISSLFALSKMDVKYKKIENGLNLILISTSLIFIFYGVFKIFTDFNNIFNITTLENFCLPSILSVTFIPFIWLVAIYSKYELFFIRLNIFTEDPNIQKYAKRKTFLLCKFNLQKLNNWSKYIYSNWRFKNKEEIDSAVLDFKNNINKSR